MADSLNLVVLSGRLVEAPELKEYNDGNVKLVRTRLATNYRQRVDKDDSNSEWESIGEFHTIEVWGNDAVFLSKYGVKGSPVTIHGRLKNGSYEDTNYTNDDGESCTRYTTVVQVVNNGLILPKMSADVGSSSSQGNSTSDAPTAPSEPEEPLPF